MIHGNLTAHKNKGLHRADSKNTCIISLWQHAWTICIVMKFENSKYQWDNNGNEIFCTCTSL